jgi:hypothetical protein
LADVLGSSLALVTVNPSANKISSKRNTNVLIASQPFPGNRNNRKDEKLQRRRRRREKNIIITLVNTEKIDI